MLNRLPDTPADELEALAAEVRRLRMDWHRPEPFYEQRSEIAGALMRISRSLAERAMPAPMPFPIRRPVPVRAMPVAVAPPPKVVAPSPPRPRRPSTRPHRYPRPPALPADVQAKLL